MKPDRNKPCPCGSGRKYKHCCEVKASSRAALSPAEIEPLVALHNAGRYAELESKARGLVSRYPGAGLVWMLLAGALQKQGKNALSAYQKTAELMPGDAGAHYDLGVALQNNGLLADAAESYRRALQIKPDYAEAHYNLAHTLRQLGQSELAAECYRGVLEIKPDFAEAHNNLGSVLKDLGQLEDAAASYRRALQIKPDFAEAHNNQGYILQVLGQPDAALASCRRALEIKPDFAEAYNNLGIAQYDLGDSGAAMASYRRALELKPDYAEAHFNLGNIQKELGKMGDAFVSYRQAVRLKPDIADAYNYMGSVLQYFGQIEDAVDGYRQALHIKPDLAEAYSNLLFCLSHSEAVDAQTLFAEHCRFGEQFEAPLRASWPQHGNSRDPARTLRVGFVSGDLRNHAVAYFIEPLLAHLSGYPQLSLHAYYNHSLEDAFTRRLKGYFAHWHSAVRQNDDALAEQIRSDGIDILIDLSGHTGKNRLMTFARKPAPIQAKSWIGYPGTTGLHAMDYYLADHLLLPLGEFDGQFTEKIVRLPAIAPFMPSKDAPPVNALPSLSNGYLTFGSFNRRDKITRSVIALWAQLLRALPDARMLLGAMNKDGNYTTLIDWFAQEGITRERLDFHVLSDMQTYLALHHQVDICLDTFPYTGGTTTLNALWMGVPTLTLSGNTAAGLQGAAILGHAGLEAFVARDAAGFVQKGLSWAGDLATLSGLRTRLRERFAQSVMGQPALIAAGLEHALRIMWQRWCEGLSPTPIDASDNRSNDRISESAIEGQ